MSLSGPILTATLLRLRHHTQTSQRVRMPLFSSEAVPPDCLCVVLGDTSSVAYIAPRCTARAHPPVPQRDGTTGLPLRRPGGHLVRRVHPTQVGLRARMPLFRSETVPPDSFCVVLGDTFVRCRTSTQVVLRRRIPLFRSETVPPDCFCVVLGDTSSVGVHQTQVVLRLRIPLLRERFPLTQCGRIVALVVCVQALLESRRQWLLYPRLLLEP